jgi:hypothetical protein
MISSMVCGTAGFKGDGTTDFLFCITGWWVTDAPIAENLVNPRLNGPLTCHRPCNLYMAASIGYCRPRY